MIKNFRNKFGKPDEVLVFLGDFDKSNYHMAGIEPVICKRFRKIFKKGGYKVYLVNEHKTSCICHRCHEELDKFLWRESKKPKDKQQDGKGKLIEIHGILSHKDYKQKCELILNRDKNAVQNMLYIVNTIFSTGKRPELFMRKKKEQNITSN